MTTFTQWLTPLFDSYPRMDEIYFHHTAQAPDGRFQLRDIEGAQAKGIGWRQMRRIRDRINALAWIFEYEVNEGIID